MRVALFGRLYQFTKVWQHFCKLKPKPCKGFKNTKWRSHFVFWYYLVMLGRKRWAIECFFKTIKHRFGLHCFGQSTQLGVYRWLILSVLAYLLAHWIEQWSIPPVLDWKATCDLTLSVLFPSVLWLKFLRYIRISADIVARHGKVGIAPSRWFMTTKLIVLGIISGHLLVGYKVGLALFQSII
jgi:hypothetical protein